jgi:hypothetical protein
LKSCSKREKNELAEIILISITFTDKGYRANSCFRCHQRRLSNNSVATKNKHFQEKLKGHPSSSFSGYTGVAFSSIEAVEVGWGVDQDTG